MEKYFDCLISVTSCPTCYYNFGSIMPGRSFSANSYRYGWNKGSESDNEIANITGAHITTYFREYDTRLGRTWSLDPKGALMPWQSPYVSMDNNPILFNDPLGDRVRIKGRKTRRTIREAKRNLSGFKEGFKSLRKRDELFVFSQVSNAKHGLVGAIRNVSRNKKGEVLKGVFVNFSVFNGDLAFEPQSIERINPLQASINVPNVVQDIDRTQRAGIPPLPPLPRPVNVNVNAPFNGGRVSFANNNTGQQQLQNAANAFLNNAGATQITITIGSSTVNLNQRSSNPDGRSVRQLLNDRAARMQQVLQGMGVPAGAFRAVQLAPGTTIGTSIQVR